MTFAVLLVCTGNLCRSVAAEQLLRADLPHRGVELLSAGTHAEEGRPAHPLTVQALTTAGIAPSAHTARRLVPEAVAVADLVLTATRDHRRDVVGLDPGAVRRTFTILEFARLIRGAGPAGSIVELRERAADSRGAFPATAADDLGDPILGGRSEHERMVADLLPAVRIIAPAVGPAALEA